MADDRKNVIDMDGSRVDDDHLLSMYIDNELDAGRTIALVQRLRAEPALRTRLNTLEANERLIRKVVARNTHAAPDRLAAMLRAENVVVMGLSARLKRWGGAAVAASAAAVLAVVVNVNPSIVFNPMAMDAQLASALEHSPSAASGWQALDDERGFRSVLTFPAADGRWCREFLMAQSETQWRGVACRDNGQWVNQVVGSEVFLEQETQYRPAGAADSEKVARFIDETATDVALGPQQEAALIASGW